MFLQQYRTIRTTQKDCLKHRACLNNFSESPQSRPARRGPTWKAALHNWLFAQKKSRQLEERPHEGAFMKDNIKSFKIARFLASQDLPQNRSHKKIKNKASPKEPQQPLSTEFCMENPPFLRKETKGAGLGGTTRYNWWLSDDFQQEKPFWKEKKKKTCPSAIGFPAFIGLRGNPCLLSVGNV